MGRGVWDEIGVRKEKKKCLRNRKKCNLQMSAETLNVEYTVTKTDLIILHSKEANLQRRKTATTKRKKEENYQPLNPGLRLDRRIWTLDK